MGHKPSTMNEALRQHLQAIVTEHPVVLFMKGTRLSPSCGFSASVVGLLDTLLDDYHTVDVLADPSVREGIKDFSNWPTIPQLYVRGEFVGGADIVREMHANGELQRALGVTDAPVIAPKITVQPKAAAMFKEAEQSAEGAVLRLEVTARFQYDLYFGEPAAGDVVVDTSGVKVHLDAASARRADGVSIDYVTGAHGAGFKIDNPNEPAKVRQVGPAQLKAMMDEGKRFELVDVRTPHEREIAHIEGSRLLDHALEHELLAMDRATPLVFQCHHGVRSLAAAEHFAQKGFREVYNLQGGIDAWSTVVDAGVPRY